MNESELSGLPEVAAGFLEPMLCEPVKVVPVGDGWVYETKLDGYRLLAVRGVGEGVTLLTRNNNSLNRKFFYIAEALEGFVPEGTVLDGELVALDERGRPSFTLLQFFRKAAPHVRYCVFDVVRLAGRDVSGLALTERKRMVRELVEGKAATVLVVEDVDGAEDVGAAKLLERVREQGSGGGDCEAEGQPVRGGGADGGVGEAPGEQGAGVCGWGVCAGGAWVWGVAGGVLPGR